MTGSKINPSEYFNISQFRLDQWNSLKAQADSLSKSSEKGKLDGEKKEDALNLISITNKLEDLKCDLAVEAVLENLEIKKDLFSKLESIIGL